MGTKDNGIYDIFDNNFTNETRVTISYFVDVPAYPAHMVTPFYMMFLGQSYLFTHYSATTFLACTIRAICLICTSLPDSCGYNVAIMKMGEERRQFYESLDAPFPTLLYTQTVGGTSAGDMMCSGHTFHTVLGVLYTYMATRAANFKPGPRKCCSIISCIYAWITALVVVVAITLSRHHWTIDIIVAIVISLLLPYYPPIHRFALNISKRWQSPKLIQYVWPKYFD